MKSLPILIGAGLLAASGFVHSNLNQQSGSSRELVLAVSRLEKIPMGIGDWVAERLSLNEHQIRLGQIAGYSHRRYENRRTGDTVSILLVCGRPGPISVHTPEACYGGIGYEPLGDRAHLAITMPQPAEFWRLELRKPGSPDEGYLRIFYAWNVSGTWEAPTGEPRLIYSHAPLLYKLYVVREMRKSNEPLEHDPSFELVRRLLPELDRILFRKD
jgi:hypothetical protein